MICTFMVSKIIVTPKLESELIVFMHFVGTLIALQCPCLTFSCFIQQKCCYMCGEYVVAYSYLLVRMYS